MQGRGEVMCYDLMSPHVMLRNNASISILNEDQQGPKSLVTAIAAHRASGPSIQGLLSYVESILEKPQETSSLGLLSPTETGHGPVTATDEVSETVKEAIDLAILRSNSVISANRSPSRFEITKSGRHVAVILLERPAYRLGEAVVAAIDYKNADVLCLSLTATLETSETVDSSISLRSEASTHRATRRAHASQSESTLFATRAVFSLIIPANATPDFITSGISLEWKIRFDFVTSPARDDAAIPPGLDELFEEVARDDRGSTMAALRVLPCESFDVTVPLRVYGATAGFGDKSELGEFPI